jgi:hypothetical protein
MRRAVPFRDRRLLAHLGPTDDLNLPGDGAQAASGPVHDVLTGVSLHAQPDDLPEGVIAEPARRAAALVRHQRANLGVGSAAAMTRPVPDIS